MRVWSSAGQQHQAKSETTLLDAADLLRHKHQGSKQQHTHSPIGMALVSTAAVVRPTHACHSIKRDGQHEHQPSLLVSKHCMFISLALGFSRGASHYH